MLLRLSMTYLNSLWLPVDVPNFTLEECVDGSRASSADGVVVIKRTFGAQNVVPDVDRYRLSLRDGRIVLRAYSV